MPGWAQLLTVRLASKGQNVLPVIIGRDVWIGADSTICGGVKIENKTFI